MIIVGLPSVILASSTPCCKRRVRLRALLGAPREMYERTCSGCRTKWTILREVLGERPGVRLDNLTWERA